MFLRNEDDCLRLLFQLRFPLRECPKCARINKHSRVSKRAAFQCACGGDYVFPKANTIFHKSATPLCIWFQIIKFLKENPNASVRSIQRMCGVTYKAAWRMKQQIKNADSKFLLRIQLML